MNTIRFSCPSCGKAIKVSESQSGKKGRCNSCGGIITVPSAEDSAGGVKDRDGDTPSHAAETQAGTVPEAGSPAGAPVEKRPQDAHVAAVAHVPAVLPGAVPVPGGMTTFFCSHCGTRIEVPKAYSGQNINCVKCGNPNKVPSSPPPVTATRSAPPPFPSTAGSVGWQLNGRTVAKRVLLTVGALLSLGLALLVLAMRMHVHEVEMAGSSLPVLEVDASAAAVLSGGVKLVDEGGHGFHHYSVLLTPRKPMGCPNFRFKVKCYDKRGALEYVGQVTFGTALDAGEKGIGSFIGGDAPVRMRLVYTEKED
jgi:DNA-directed RNA polymerase subunit M/transcription elongation factor TFIIS